MKVILTGATGYVGEGTLLELLKVDAVEKVWHAKGCVYAYLSGDSLALCRHHARQGAHDLHLPQWCWHKS